MSSFKMLLMPLGLRGQTAERLQGALAVANHFQAHLQVLFTYVSPREMIPEGIFGMSQAAMSDLTRVADEQAAESAKQRREVFMQICRRQGVTLSDQPLGSTVSASWREATGLRSRLIAQHGRLADLIIVAKPPQPQPSATIRAALTETGRPVLLMPRTQIRFSADNIAIAWNASGEIARTLEAALALLQAASQVSILTTQAYRNTIPSLDELLAYLNHHGIAAAARIIDSDGKSLGTALLDEAYKLGAELLICGGYGRKHRLRSGVTQSLLSSTHLPVLMAH